MNGIRRFMAGRYGADQFMILLVVLALIINAIGNIFHFGVLSLIAAAIAVYAVYRVLSRDIGKRSEENARFLAVLPSVKTWIGGKLDRLKHSKTHKFFKCPGCKNVLRVPRGKGKLHITCPKCGQRFDGKT